MQYMILIFFCKQKQKQEKKGVSKSVNKSAKCNKYRNVGII